MIIFSVCKKNTCLASLKKMGKPVLYYRFTHFFYAVRPTFIVGSPDMSLWLDLLHPHLACGAISIAHDVDALLQCVLTCTRD